MFSRVMQARSPGGSLPGKELLDYNSSHESYPHTMHSFPDEIFAYEFFFDSFNRLTIFSSSAVPSFDTFLLNI